jgi:hypothetical protein
MLVLIWHGMMAILMNIRRDHGPTEAVEKTTKYMRDIALHMLKS